LGASAVQGAQVIQGLIVLVLSLGLFGQIFYFLRLRSRLNHTEAQLKTSGEREQELNNELMEYKTKFTQEVLRDAVTNLPCVSLFKDQVGLILNQSERNKTLFGILFLDLRNFKIINNTLGYTMGDRVLKEVADRLQISIRQIDAVCRFSGDIFVILLSQLSHPESAALIVRRLFEKLEEPFHVDRHELFVALNIGIAIYPVDGEDIDTLFRNAAQALSQAKASGSQQYQFYRPDMHNHSQRELSLNSALCRDLIFQEFMVEYQPQFNIETNEIFGWEVLLRWQHPEFGMISPREFIRLAENNGRIEVIGEWILQHVCHQLRLWQTQGYIVPPLSLNISLRQLESNHFISTILRIIKETQINPKLLVFEISESDILKQTNSLERAFNVLGRLGIKITVDHFEGGDVLLRYLKQYPMDYLKIDSTFIRDLATSKESEAIINMMVFLAKNLNKKIIALGVETENQKYLLQKLGCTLMQGYLFSPPLNELEVAKKLEVSSAKSVQNEEVTVS
jgi:diguanylate cyclase (GGDEF)-like protein